MQSIQKTIEIKNLQNFFHNKIAYALIIVEYKDDVISFPYHWKGLEIIDDGSQLYFGELIDESRPLIIKKNKIKTIECIENAIVIKMIEGRQLVITYEAEEEFEDSESI